MPAFLPSDAPDGTIARLAIWSSKAVSCRQFRRNHMRKIIGLALAAGALTVSACNTTEGAGKDVSSAGDTVAKTADKSK